jgi:hypothetical protein
MKRQNIVAVGASLRRYSPHGDRKGREREVGGEGEREGEREEPGIIFKDMLPVTYFFR